MRDSLFFSSRRRHTISKRDWSSDVCSSDLAFLFSVSLRDNIAFGRPAASMDDVIAAARAAQARSEERRVGKESSIRWAADVSIKTIMAFAHESRYPRCIQ